MFTGCTLTQHVAHKTSVAQQFTPQKHYRLPHPGQGILDPAPAIYASQPTTLPSAFSIMPPQDPTWHMDTGASSHLNFNASNLSTIFDKRLFSSVHVGDGKSIPVTNTDHSIIPSHHRPIHLYNVLVTPNIIKNLISVRQPNTEAVHEPPRTHPMITRSQSGIVKPIDRLSLHTSSISPIPKNPSHALKDPNWRNAMYDEYNALVKNGTWLLVPRPACVNMVCFMWLFKHKFHADGTLSRSKARLVANGSSQQLGVDFDETFSPVVKPATVRTVLSLAVSRKRPIRQLDVKNAFLNGYLSETVYMHQPPSYATRAGFYHSRCDSSLLIYRQGSQVACLLIYVDAIILTASCPVLFKQIISSLNKEFDMTDLRALYYFLGISADRTPTGLFLSQKKYALQLLERAHMVTCNPSRTPVDTESKLGPEGVLDYDSRIAHLSYAVKQICLYMHDPREPHFAALKRILRYVRGTMDFGLHLYLSTTTSLVGYTDADWAFFSHLHQFYFSAKAEYRGVANVVAETAWVRNLLRELHSPLMTATLVYCDNVSAVYIFANPVQHQRTKHIEIDIHFVRDMVTVGHVRVLYVPSRF
ncbi:ribonuclease H-like domain-containing protein [Tanacetum coccineum]